MAMNERIYDGRVIDGHCHVSSHRFIPRAFFRGLAENVQVKLAANGIDKSVDALLDGYISSSTDHQADKLVAEMDKAGIEKAVVLLPDFTYVMQADLSIADMIAEHTAIKARHEGRFAVFVGIDPRWGKDGIDLFERSIADGTASGLKLYPPCGYSASDESLFPFYEICSEAGLPVLLHTGPTAPSLRFEHFHPFQIDEAAYKFPRVNFILAHGAVTSLHDTALMCAYRPNVYTDVSAFLGSMDPRGWAAGLADAFRMGINHKIIFGTDWPLFQNAGGHKRVLDRFVNEKGPLAGISAAQQAWLMHRNITRLVPEFREDSSAQMSDFPKMEG